jgi:proteic killer suppression protein
LAGIENDPLASPYRDKKTERFARGQFVSQCESFRIKAYEKLEFLESASCLMDLRSPPSNHFEKLSGNRNAQYSIRINSQWCICFEWAEKRMSAFNIEIVDYH